MSIRAGMNEFGVGFLEIPNLLSQAKSNTTKFNQITNPLTIKLYMDAK
jgi:hypothetical protein